jgi:hypothetical protein
MIQAKPEDRANLESINNIYVKMESKVAISQFVDFKRIYGPEAVSRFNMLKRLLTEKQILDLVLVMLLKRFKKLLHSICQNHIPMNSQVDTRRDSSR